ncbi:hypothetical protein CDV55_104668 [Aspergillus turcosus]|nr:hypothetical protein CDV55_104668 [Aspergillus turcosus]
MAPKLSYGYTRPIVPSPPIRITLYQSFITATLPLAPPPPPPQGAPRRSCRQPLSLIKVLVWMEATVLFPPGSSSFLADKKNNDYAPLAKTYRTRTSQAKGHNSTEYLRPRVLAYLPGS